MAGRRVSSTQYQVYAYSAMQQDRVLETAVEETSHLDHIREKVFHIFADLGCVQQKLTWSGLPATKWIVIQKSYTVVSLYKHKLTATRVQKTGVIVNSQALCGQQSLFSRLLWRLWGLESSVPVLELDAELKTVLKVKKAHPTWRHAVIRWSWLITRYACSQK